MKQSFCGLSGSKFRLVRPNNNIHKINATRSYAYCQKLGFCILNTFGRKNEAFLALKLSSMKLGLCDLRLLGIKLRLVQPNTYQHNIQACAA